MKYILLTLTGFLFAVLQSSCNDLNSHKNNQLHPKFDADQENINSLMHNDIEDQEIINLKNRFQKLSLLDEIDEGYIFGNITDIEFDNNFNLYLLDLDQVKVFKVWDSEIDTLGSKGRGPGEMLFPWSLEIDSLNNIYVSDLQRGITNIKSNEEEVDILTRSSYSDLKKTDNGFFLRKEMIMSPNPEGKINTIDFYDVLEDTITYSFGNAYKNRNQLAVQNYSSGLMEYLKSNNIILTINIHSPYLYAYKSGEEIWKRKIENFISFEMTSTDEPLSIKYHTKFTEKENKYDEIKTLEQISDKYVLIQILRASFDDNSNKRGEIKLKSYILDSELGQAYRIDDMHQVVAIKDNRLVIHEKTDNSNLKLYSF
ncbi:hypothetical protein [Gracilimonas sp.]|uniref:hypothetical protein n=1 Tax=Gracilimonas sp. TaxID=1974203 RepID=UPI002871E462|nr:hypothetical protein [Gracilimonas sp.]